MKWRANSESFKPRHYEIKHDPFAGFYLYVFENGRCINDASSRCVRNHHGMRLGILQRTKKRMKKD